MEVKQQFIELSHKNALKVINSTCSVHIRTNELIVKNELIAITTTTIYNNKKFLQYSHLNYNKNTNKKVV